MTRSQSGILLLLLLLLIVKPSVSAQGSRIAIQAGINHGSQTDEFARSFGDDKGPLSEDLGTSTLVILRITKHLSLFREYAVARFGLDNLEVEGGRYRIPYRVTGVRYWIPTFSDLYLYLQCGIGRYQSLFRGSLDEVNLDIESDWASGKIIGGGLLLPFGRLGIDVGISYHTVHVQYRPPGQPPDQTTKRLEQDITWFAVTGSISLALVKR